MWLLIFGGKWFSDLLASEVALSFFRIEKAYRFVGCDALRLSMALR